MLDSDTDTATRNGSAWWTSPAGQVGLFVLLQSICWTFAPGLAHRAPPLDTVEVYMWARDWILVSNKHPNMAGWLLAASQWLTGSYGWSAYILAQVCTAVTVIFVYLLGRELVDDRTAMLGAILPFTLAYFNWMTPQFNSNIASMPFWAAFVWAVWKARSRGTTGWWLVVGLIGAGVVYCKISGGILLLVAGLYAIVDPRLRGQLLTPGPWLAVGVFAALFLPAALEIQRQGFLVFEHAAGKAKGGPNVFSFLGAQLLMCSGMVIALAMSARRNAAANSDPVSRINDDHLRFVTAFAAGPILISLVQSLVFSTRLRDLWAIPMGSFFGLAALVWLQRFKFHIDDLRLRQLVAGIMLVTPIAYVAVKGFGTLNGQPPTTAWPQKTISERLEAIWDAETKAPLRFVAGDAWEGGLVALTAKHSPSLLIDMSAGRAPWIPLDRMNKAGFLTVWPYRYQPDGNPVAVLDRTCSPRPVSFDWSGRSDLKPLVLHYCIFPPRP